MIDSMTIGVILALLSGLVAAPGPLFIKRASKSIKKVQDFMNLDLFFGMGFYAISVILSLIALKFGDLSVIGPIFSSVYVWVTIISIKFLNERISPKRMIGILSVIIGIILIGSGL